MEPVGPQVDSVSTSTFTNLLHKSITDSHTESLKDTHTFEDKKKKVVREVENLETKHNEKKIEDKIEDTKKIEDTHNENRRPECLNDMRMLGLKQAHLVGNKGSANKKKLSKQSSASANKASADRQIDIRRYYIFKTSDGHVSGTVSRGKVEQGVKNSLHSGSGNPDNYTN